jgi:hypothetical protein
MHKSQEHPECYGSYGIPAPLMICAICDVAHQCRNKAIENAMPTDHAKAMNRQVGGSHYKDMAIQPIQFIEGNELSFSAGNVIKYICRADKKGGVEDLEKAKHYIDLMIERMGK